ncbi:hypothetical protein HXX76_015975 [Chlamydomonas incerta]|uniref:Uncharacterized protein n=1 Tax=Chlamydomonas incerta TaxID=51695 RepID=A0A835SBG3_CHLIN|nr:hypothetical protein HXX76_015975 [Chlamydomonas incerta]|eukprot:KAG2422506.1 hypothetical protein HXX76_015975 [Chlamydomonas incerta]
MLPDLQPGRDSDFEEFISRNIALLRHLDVPQPLWAPLYETLTTGSLRGEDEPAGHVSSRRALDETDADAVVVEDADGEADGGAGPFHGAFTCRWQQEEAAAAVQGQGQQQQRAPRRRRVMVAARDLPAGGVIWAAAPLLCEPGRKRLQARLQNDTALLVRLAAALLPDEDEDEAEEGGEQDADGEAEAEALSMHDSLLKQLRPLLLELVSQFEMPPAGPGLAPVQHKFLPPPSLAAMRAVGVGTGVAPPGAVGIAPGVAAGESSPGVGAAGCEPPVGPVLAVAPFPYWARGGCCGQWRFGLAVLAWPLRDVRRGEELTRSRLSLGLADFSCFDYWAAAYREADDTHEWYTEAGAMDTLMTALTRLAPPPPPPPPAVGANAAEHAAAAGEDGKEEAAEERAGKGAEGEAAGPCSSDPSSGGGQGGGGWAGRRALVAGCGNSALGYQMWQQGYPAVDNVDYVPEVVRLMEAKYGIGGTAICRTADLSSTAVGAGSTAGAAVVGGGGGLALGAVAAAVAGCGSAGSDVASVASYYSSSSNVNGSSRRSSSTGIAAEADSVCISPEGSVRGGAIIGLGTDGDGCGIAPFLIAAAVATAAAPAAASPAQSPAHAQQEEGEEEEEHVSCRGGSSCSDSGSGSAGPLLSGCHGGAVRWLVGDLTAMSQTPGGWYDLVVDKATLDALWSPAVDLAAPAPEVAPADAAPAPAAGAADSSSSSSSGGGASSAAAAPATAGGGKAGQWRHSAAELQIVFKYLAEMSRVTAAHGRFVVITLRGPQAMGQMLDKAAEVVQALTQQEGVVLQEAEAPAGDDAGCLAPWRVLSHEELAGGRDGQALSTHMYVLCK